MKRALPMLLLLLFSLTLLVGCQDDDDDDDSSSSSSSELTTSNTSETCNSTNDLSAIPDDYVTAMTKYTTTNSEYKVYVCAQDSDGDGIANFMLVQSTDRPEHKSYYHYASTGKYETFDFDTNLYKYEAAKNAANYSGNPGSAGSNMIDQQNIVMKMPIDPAEATTKTATDYDTIGIALNGVSFFNENAAPGDEITNELFTFDQCSGHPQQQGVYHYHVDPVCLIRDLGGDVTNSSKTVSGTTYTWLDDAGTNADLLLGFVMDGFPVYGPQGNGETDCNGNSVPSIDDYNGHSHCTTEFPDGVYHYHVKTGNGGATQSDIFWITNTSFYGNPGSVVN